MARIGLKLSFFSRKFWPSVACISDLIIYTYCLQIHIANLDGENETFSVLIDIEEPKCEKRKLYPEPADKFTSRSSLLDDSSNAFIDFSEFDEFDMWGCCNLFVIFSTIFTMLIFIIVPDG